MTLEGYYWQLTAAEQVAYAKAAGTSREYLRIHLIPRDGVPDRTPGSRLMHALADASGGRVRLAEVLDHFYQHKSTA